MKRNRNYYKTRNNTAYGWRDDFGPYYNKSFGSRISKNLNDYPRFQDAYGPASSFGYGSSSSLGDQDYGFADHNVHYGRSKANYAEEDVGPDYYKYAAGDYASGPFQEKTGPYRGVGPIGWQRTDSNIYEDVCERLSENPNLDASEIRVTVNSGEVTLSGRISDRHSKRLAEHIADSISGVKDVHNQLKLYSRQEEREKEQSGRTAA